MHIGNIIVNELLVHCGKGEEGGFRPAGVPLPIPFLLSFRVSFA